jgi:hypothetical protein
MVIGPGKMEDAVRDGVVRVTGAFSAEFPYAPIVRVFLGEEGEEGREGVAVGSLRVCGGRARCGDYCTRSRVSVLKGAGG